MKLLLGSSLNTEGRCSVLVTKQTQDRTKLENTRSCMNDETRSRNICNEFESESSETDPFLYNSNENPDFAPQLSDLDNDPIQSNCNVLGRPERKHKIKLKGKKIKKRLRNVSEWVPSESDRSEGVLGTEGTENLNMRKLFADMMKAMETNRISTERMVLEVIKTKNDTKRFYIMLDLSKSIENYDGEIEKGPTAA
ncbi:hypothetical protein ILUMI_15589 [Ignelater luminosus]|uniref:Uncharacterized protein n=1 Tax=Ignelater luminosus TaxID=2038154 RepID=A0A8K0CQ65_IGNLU|nr:hypothetical protein ILUMI_15589 [Ignelater luminosus]